MKIIIVKNYEEMSDEAFKFFKKIVVENPNGCLGLATGTTPLGLYSRMIEDHKANGTSYKNIRTVNLDEYCGLDINSDQSYIYFMRKNLFEGLDIDLNNTHIEDGKALDTKAECDRYNKLLADNIPDVQLLGIGSDGHIAFNEPGTPFNSTTHIAELAESTIKDNSRLFNDISEVPTKAFTQGLQNIMNAKRVLLIANGANKAKAIYGLVKGPITEDVPASILQLHPDCTIIVDEAAAELIK